MQARDVMTREVVSAGPETVVADIARIFVERRISAVPIVRDGKLVGIVSEGDLMHRPETGTEPRRSWWLKMLSESQELAREFVKTHGLTAKDVMSAPVVTVVEDTELREIARVLQRHHIKRVPVMQGERMVGIVSRPDLLQALASGGARHPEAADDGALRDAVLAAFKAQPWAPDRSVNVDVRNGRVDLHGMVRSEDERQALRVAAEEIAGVGRVDNRHLSVAGTTRVMG